MTESKSKKELTSHIIHQKKLNRRSQQAILAVLVAILLTILILSPITRVFPELLPFSGKPLYHKSIYGSERKLILSRPLGIDVSKTTGDVYVADTGNKRIVRFNNDGELKSVFGQDRLNIPVYLALDSVDNVYVTDRVLRKIAIYSKDGEFKGYFENSNLHNPLGIAIDKENNLYVSDVGKRHCIRVFDSDGNLIRTFGQTKKVSMPQADKGSFYFPNGIDVDTEGNIYVADSNNNRVQIFDKFAEPKSIIAMGGLPRGIAVNDKNKTVYVIDTIAHKVSVYDKANKYLVSFSKQGRGNEDFMYPSGIALDNEDKLFITDRNNARVQVFDTVIKPLTIARRLLPLLPLISLPWLFLLLLILLSKKKRYVTSPCFIEQIMKGEKLDHFLGSVKKFYVTEGCHSELKKNKLIESFGGKINTRPHDAHFADNLRKEYSLSKHEAEVLALAHHKGLYHPVLLASSKKLITAAKLFGVDVLHVKDYLKQTEEK